ncbi:hypothetical protein EJ08DRAFT_693362 [Tothia fuscella]|uniref:Uncharacterized protein n=1 Tax=Tothia fuscella TaxID=1048955 RepID=A0A9P4U3C4_9PEZI|nr:hypothetical protein EJ08DRAFT_693362 [Tothia fuscella]
MASEGRNNEDIYSTQQSAMLFQRYRHRQIEDTQYTPRNPTQIPLAPLHRRTSAQQNHNHTESPVPLHSVQQHHSIPTDNAATPNGEPQRRTTILPIQPFPKTTLHRMAAFKSKQISGKWTIILTNATLTFVPMIVFASALLLVIFGNSIDLQNFPGYPIEEYYFIQGISPNSIIALTSFITLWTIVCYGCLFTLTSFLHANEILRLSEGKDAANLPTAHEFAVLLMIVSGSLMGYFRGNKCILKRPLRQHFIIQRAIIWSSVILFLCFTILIGDIWLHVSTRSLVAPEVISQSNTVMTKDIPNYGRKLSTGCGLSINGTPISIEYSFAENACDGRMDMLMGGLEAHRTARGTSNHNEVVILDFPGLKDFYNETISILVEAKAPAESSYMASTYGVATMFKSIGKECHITDTRFSWNCADYSFGGTMTHPVMMPGPELLKPLLNVVKWVMAAKVDGEDTTFEHLENDPDIVIDGASLFTVMHCETAIYKVDYLKLGSKYIPQSVKPANISVAELIYSPMFPGRLDGFEGFGAEILASQFTSSALSSASKSELEHHWAQALAKLTIASASGIMDSVPIKIQFHILTAMPKTPFWLLFSATFIYAVFTLGLTVTATRNVLAKAEVRDVQARMGFEGLVVLLLDPKFGRGAASSMGDLFRRSEAGQGYSDRVTIVKTGTGGWSWSAPPSRGSV